MRFTTATTVDEALAALAEGARPIAGGSDMMVGHRQGKTPLPGYVVAIDRIESLRQIETTAHRVTIGALVSHHIIESHPLIGSHYSALADSSALVGSPSTRNVGTIGGNVMNASPAMDTGAPLIVLGATAQMRSTRSSRSVAMHELWLSPGRTSAAADELCVAITLPARLASSGSAYVRLEYRRAMEIAVVGAAASITLDGDGNVAGLAVALTAVAATIISVTGLGALHGRSVTDAVAEIQRIAADQAQPISDLRASDRYRRHCVGVMAGRAVEAAAHRASGGVICVPVNRSLGIGAAS